METNLRFLKAIEDSFNAFLSVGTSRSTAKLKPLHGFIADELSKRLGEDFTVVSQGFGDDKEATVQGRYHEKKVDIAVMNHGKAVAGIGVKFVMQNYMQNSNNYFENMMGETANLRCRRHPYFQVFILLDEMPYYNKDRQIKRWETPTEHNLSKYVALSADNSEVYMHTPDKTLLYVVSIPKNRRLTTKNEYMDYYRRLKPEVKLSDLACPAFHSGVILNNLDAFLQKVFHTVMAL